MKILLAILLMWATMLSFPCFVFGGHQPEKDTALAMIQSVIEDLHKKAIIEYRFGNYQKAENYYKEIVTLKEKMMPDDLLGLAGSYVNMGVMYSRNWNFKEALDYYEKAEKLFIKIRNNDVDIAKTIINKGNLHMKLGDPLKSIAYYEQAERLIRSKNEENNEILGNIYSNLAIGAINAKLYDTALYYLSNAKKYINEKDKESLKRLYHNYTNVYRVTNEIEKANKVYQVSLKTYKNEFDIYKGYFNYGYFLITYNIDLEKGLEYVRAGLRYYEENKINSPIFKAFALQIKGSYHEKKNELLKALSYYQQSIILVSDQFNDTTISANPEEISNTYDGRILIYLKDKARVLLKYYEVNPDTCYLRYALHSSLKAVEIINRMRYRYTSEASNFLISEKEKYTFDFAEKVAYLLYSKTGDPSFMDMAFTMNEQGRAFSLLSSIRKRRATEYGGIPDKILAEEKDLNRRLSMFEELIFQEKQAGNADSSKIISWKTKLFEVEQEYDKFITRLEKEFPGYHALKYDQHVTNPKEIRAKIAKNTTLIDYSILDSVLLIYFSDNRKTGVKEVALKKGFEESCAEFSSVITKQSFSNGVMETYKKFTDLGFELYQVLIKPVEDHITTENMIIIPDGAISYVPFDALLTESVSQSRLDYRNLPYLIRKYSTGYSYSATFHFNPIRHARIQNQSVLAFAPSYAGVALENDSLSAPGKPGLSSLMTLPGVGEEVRRISKIIEAEVYTDAEATENNFKAYADQYRILHLAMHTLIDDENPMFSRLAFTYHPSDTTQDNFLHTYEIYNMKFNASLAVLSSCASGYGKMQEGEGIQSLARAFAFAGCPSILMTLWEVADLSTVFMMDRFYTYLKEHDPKPVALRKAKLNYLQDADQLKANPFFWSSYVIIGDSNPVFPFLPVIQLVNILLLILPLIYMAFALKKYQKERNGNHIFYRLKESYSAD